MTTKEKSVQVTKYNYMVAYAAVLKHVFSCRHDISIEELLGGSETGTLLLEVYVNLPRKVEW